MDKQQEGAQLQVRMSEAEKAQVERLAGAYGVTVSQLVRLMTAHFAEQRPVVAVPPKSKRVAA